MCRSIAIHMHSAHIQEHICTKHIQQNSLKFTLQTHSTKFLGEMAEQMHKLWVTINITCLKWYKTVLGRMKWDKTIQVNRGWLIEEDLDLDSVILGDTKGYIGAHCVKELKENSRK